MHSTTLRGIFPEPKPVYRRNFIKENVKSIKQMQGILQEAGALHSRKKPPRESSKVRLAKSKEDNTTRSMVNLTQLDERIHCSGDRFNTRAMSTVKSQLARAVKVKHAKPKEPPIAKIQEKDGKLTDRAMQTEREEDLFKLYESGVIKYPSHGLVSPSTKGGKGSVVHRNADCGDHLDDVGTTLENLAIEDRDFIKENKNFKVKPPKQSPVKVIAQAPQNYQRGVVPKYLRDRKEEQGSPVEDAQCPPGHVLLPDEERKETLRVLRQSYADRIQELNMMPVRNDTLKMKKRKMEIEEELKRIDGGIKVFQRPKVFVKINA